MSSPMTQLNFPWSRTGRHGQPVYCDECGYTLRQEDGVCEVCEETSRQRDEEEAWWRMLDSSREED